jgi:hypothetical protein
MMKLRRFKALPGVLVPSVLMVSCLGHEPLLMRDPLRPGESPAAVEFDCGSLTLAPSVTCEEEEDKLVSAEAQLTPGVSQKGWFSTKCGAKGRLDWAAQCAFLPRSDLAGSQTAPQQTARKGFAVTVVMDSTAECGGSKGLVAAALPVHRSRLEVKPGGSPARVRLTGALEVFRQTMPKTDSKSACTLTIGTENIRLPLGGTLEHVATLPPGTHELLLDCRGVSADAIGLRCTPPKGAPNGKLVRQSSDSWTQQKVAARLVFEVSSVDENTASQPESGRGQE